MCLMSFRSFFDFSIYLFWPFAQVAADVCNLFLREAVFERIYPWHFGLFLLVLLLLFCFVFLALLVQVADEAIGHKAGDLVFIIETLPHPDFTRRNDDLHMDMDILLIDALVSPHHQNVEAAPHKLCAELRWGGVCIGALMRSIRDAKSMILEGSSEHNRFSKTRLSLWMRYSGAAVYGIYHKTRWILFMEIWFEQRKSNRLWKINQKEKRCVDTDSLVVRALTRY